jgi:hypothetical protein
LLLAKVPTEQWLWSCETESDSARIPVFDAGCVSRAAAPTGKAPNSLAENALWPDSTSSPCSHTAWRAEIWWKIVRSGVTARSEMVSAASHADPRARRLRVVIALCNRDRPIRFDPSIGPYSANDVVSRYVERHSDDRSFARCGTHRRRKMLQHPMPTLMRAARVRHSDSSSIAAPSHVPRGSSHRRTIQLVRGAGMAAWSWW